MKLRLGSRIPWYVVPWLDANATGWCWFVDTTPGDDSEFPTHGNQGEKNRIDLLTVLEHELATCSASIIWKPE